MAPHLQSVAALVGAARPGKHAARVGVLLAALAPPGPPAAVAAPQRAQELFQVVAVEVGAAEYQTLLHPAWTSARGACSNQTHNVRSAFHTKDALNDTPLGLGLCCVSSKDMTCCCFKPGETLNERSTRLLRPKWCTQKWDPGPFHCCKLWNVRTASEEQGQRTCRHRSGAAARAA